MKNDRPVRKKNRLPDFDYSYVGEYFITICTKDKQKLFWIDDPSLYKDCRNYQELLNALGKHASSVIERTESVYHGSVAIDKYVVMPDHIHMIVVLYDRKGRIASIPQIVKQIKRSITVESGVKDLWQKGYYDHIIRNEKDYNETWDYIDANPRKLTGSIFME